MRANLLYTQSQYLCRSWVTTETERESARSAKALLGDFFMAGTGWETVLLLEIEATRIYLYGLAPPSRCGRALLKLIFGAPLSLSLYSRDKWTPGESRLYPSFSRFQQQPRPTHSAKGPIEGPRSLDSRTFPCGGRAEGRFAKGSSRVTAGKSGLNQGHRHECRIHERKQSPSERSRFPGNRTLSLRDGKLLHFCLWPFCIPPPASLLR